MCGINGIVTGENIAPDLLRPVVEAMRVTMNHRGPDAAGVWAEEKGRVGFGHCRLAILDLSPAGEQPMASDSGRYVICFNGEVYNFLELKAAIEKAGKAPKWRGGSDTEVMLAAFEAWGIERAVPRFNGMFAFAVYDRVSGRVFLVRDRAGVKPLYVARAGKDLLFASEIRAFEAVKGFDRSFDHGAINYYLAYGYFRGGASIYRDAGQVPPGAILELSGAVDWGNLRTALCDRAEAPTSGRGWAMSRFWSAAEAWLRGQSTPFTGSFEEALNQASSLLRDAVSIRLLSDVPLGAFLSGGIDSSLVVALMRQVNSAPVRTFTIGFDDPAHDESRFAAEVAKHLGTDHTEYQVTEKDALQVATSIGSLLDQPLGDSSFIPTFLVSRLTRQKVTVAMTGDGGDEVCWGYWRMYRFQNQYPVIRLMRPAIGMARALGGGLLSARMRRRLDLLGRIAAEPTMAGRYEALNSQDARVFGLEQPGIPPGMVQLAHPSAAFSLREFSTYLPDDLLIKVDRASMAVSLESREPLLDYRWVEFAASLPPSFKAAHGKGKRILRELLLQSVPLEMIDRPKKGFSVPIRKWLRGSLREWGADLVSSRNLADGTGLDPKRLQAKWEQFQGGRSDEALPLWYALVLLDWRRNRQDASQSAAASALAA